MGWHMVYRSACSLPYLLLILRCGYTSYTGLELSCFSDSFFFFFFLKSFTHHQGFPPYTPVSSPPSLDTSFRNSLSTKLHVIFVSYQWLSFSIWLMTTAISQVTHTFWAHYSCNPTSELLHPSCTTALSIITSEFHKTCMTLDLKAKIQWP